MKRGFLLLAALLLLTLLPACAGEPEAEATTLAAPEDLQGTSLRVAASIFPSYDFVRQIAGDLVELTLLVPPGMDTHAFDPTAQDILHIYHMDLLIYVGGKGERWMDTILASLNNREDMRVVTLIDLVEGIEVEQAQSPLLVTTITNRD